MCRLFQRLFGRSPRVEPEPIEPEPIEPDPIEPDPIEPDPIEPDPIEPDPIEPDPIDPSPPRDRPVPHDPPSVDSDPPREPEPVRPVPYVNAGEYLRDELSRIDFLVKAYLIRRRAKSADADPARDVTAARFEWVDPILDADIRRESDRLIAKAGALETIILLRLELTGGLASFPLWELARAFQLAPATGGDPARDTVFLDVVLLALLVGRFPRYLPALAPDGSTGLTAGAALDILQPGAPPNRQRWDAFAPDRPPVANGLIELDPADSPARRTFRIDPRTADYLLETPNPTVDLPGVRAVVAPREWDDLLLDPGPRNVLANLSARWWDTGRRPLRLTLLLYGPAGSPFLEAVEAFLTRTVDGERRAMPFLRVDGTAARVADWDGFIRRLYRESLYRRCPVVWMDAGAMLASDQPPARWDALVRAAEASALPTFLSGETPWDPSRAFHAPGLHFARVELPLPAPPTRRAIWKDRLARERNPLAADRTPVQKTALDLIETFQFTHGQIDDAVATARGLALVANPVEPAATSEHLYEACRRQSARRLVSFATRIQPRPDESEAGIDPKELLAKKVVLPPAAAAQLQELFERMRSFARVYHDLGFEQRLHLGRGLVALFSGPTGTGKTLAATTLAALNGKDLYRVDMAAVVSKFVGETEKNLGRVFADAQDANAVLFFDEADALFGKRGSVEQGQDRWANLEVNYLLQRVEEYTGTVILATNIRENIDEAFLRRIQVLLEFPRPNEAARLNILDRMFPPRVGRPDDKVLADFARRFDVTGGNIKNAVLDAAFRAVADAGGSEGDVTITDEHLALGFAREYQKIGLPITPGVFGRKYFQLAADKLRLDGPRAADLPRRGTG